MANEKPVELPSGGRAWVTTARSHAEADTIRRHHMKIGRFMGPATDADGKRVRDWRPDLTAEELDAKDELTLGTSPLYVRTLTRRWEGVNDAQGNPLSFPDDVERMRDDDLEALAGATIVDPPDPKGSETSAPSPVPGDSQPTPTSEPT